MPRITCATIIVAALLAAAALHPVAAGGTTEGPGTAPASLSVSPDGRFIVRADGKPFFWLADTAWELFHRTTREEADLYLSDRARKGFTVIQAVVLAELDGLNTPNSYGERPLVDNDPARPNDKYFQHVDYIVSRAAELGLVVAMLPTWGDKWNKRWGVGPTIFTPQNAAAYGEFLGKRYKDAPIIWMLGGDRSPETDEHLVIIRNMAQGLEKGDEGRHLMTFHPMGGNQSSKWFHNDAWLDFNLFQSGHSDPDIPNYRMTEHDYSLTPVKPVIDGEPRYEDHPINWNPDNGWFDQFDVRQAGYWSVLSGAAGHTYGNHDIWQFWQQERDPISWARTPWKEAIAHPGAAQVGFMRHLFESRPFLMLVPDQAVIATEPGPDAGAMLQRAARCKGGSYAIVYSPYGRPITVQMNVITGAQVRAWWFDPRTGAATEIGYFPNTGTQAFNPPGVVGRGNDWVLVLDEASKQYTAPGLPVP